MTPTCHGLSISRKAIERAKKLREALPNQYLILLVSDHGERFLVEDELQPFRGTERDRCAVCVRFPVEAGASVEIWQSHNGPDVCGPADPVLKALASVHSELVTLCDQVDQLAEQTTHWLEEVCFLRNLACMLDLSGKRRTEAILESLADELRTLCKAETLLVVSSRGKDSPTVRSYGAAVSETALTQILAFIEGIEGTWVSNDPEAPDGVPSEGISSILVVPFHSQDAVTWFVLLNSTSPDGFGTIEASLLETTGSVLAVHANNLKLLEELEQFLVDMIQALVSAIDAKDPYTCGHSARVAHVSRCIAEELGLDSDTCHNVFLAGLLHDVGKIGVEDRVLRKPGRLTDEEFEEIKKHPGVGYRILAHLERLAFALPGVLHHHERYDGRGYPTGLAGDNIPLIARIIAVADSFDAMASDRPYRNGMPIEKVLNILREGAGTQWDEKVVSAFLNAFDRIYSVWQRYNVPQVSFEDLKGQTLPARSSGKT